MPPWIVQLGLPLWSCLIPLDGLLYFYACLWMWVFSTHKSYVESSWAVARRVVFVFIITCFYFYRYCVLSDFNENKNVDLKHFLVSKNNFFRRETFVLYFKDGFLFSFGDHIFLMRDSHSNNHFSVRNLALSLSTFKIFLILLGFQPFTLMKIWENFRYYFITFSITFSLFLMGIKLHVRFLIVSLMFLSPSSF